MRKPLHLTIRLNEVSKKEWELVGNKGANLGEMLKMGLPVPSGFCVTVQAYHQFLNRVGLSGMVGSLGLGPAAGDAETANEVLEELRRRVGSETIPKLICRDITTAYRNLSASLGEENVRVAVRSSATIEDLPRASFAGQFSTFLGVRGTVEILTAVKGCWASLFFPRVLVYAMQRQVELDFAKIGVGVVVQEMVDSDVSGVVFTVNPSRPQETVMIIQASWGLGESVVAGRVTPDTYLIDKQSLRILDQTLGTKKTTRRLRERGTEEMKTPASDRTRFSLDESILRELSQIALTIERHFRAPQDIEWALTGNAILVLQTRPLTGV